MENAELKKLVDALAAGSDETEWFEFKENFHSREEIGERISALSNSACILKKPYAYLIFGVEDKTHTIKGTDFCARSAKKGNEELEMWLLSRLKPAIDFQTIEFDYDENRHISMYKIPAASNEPVAFLNEAYIRVGSLTKKLVGFPEKAAKIWRNRAKNPLDTIVVKEGLSCGDVVSLLSVESYFDLMKIPLPQSSQGIVDRFCQERLVQTNESGYAITELGALLFAKNLGDFDGLNRKAIRVIVYKGKNKVETVRERCGKKGYAVEFPEIIEWINSQLPANEEIGKTLRRDVRMYPEISIREFVVNSIIHQDFMEPGFPMVEIYSDRIEISNPGVPMIDSNRFIDEYVSRNDSLADIMRRMGFCEEKGSGWDKAVFYNELYQLPPFNILIQENRTVVAMYAYKALNSLEKEERIRACYQHACLKYVSNEKMTNQSLRNRFGIEEQNSAVASRIIRETLEARLIKEDDPEKLSRKFKKYIPLWAS